MSRLTDLQTIYRMLATPWSRCSLYDFEIPRRLIETARTSVFEQVHKEQEAIERERVTSETYRAALEAWQAEEPEKPWREDQEYAAARRAWEARKPRKV